MNNIMQSFSKNRFFLSMGILWILFWVVPWGVMISFDGNIYVVFFLDMLKLGVALGLFILPGAMLFILLRSESSATGGRWSVLPVGFALSVTIIGLVGLAGRFLGLSFATVKYIFMSIGLGELILLAVFVPNLQFRKIKVVESFWSIVENTPLLLALILAISIAFNGYQFFIDDTTYAAYATNWLNSTHLGFTNIVHQMNVVEHSRFWLALYPMGQALLSSLSGVPVVLLFSSYLELFLVPLAVLTAYWFASILGLSRRDAGISVLIQMLLYIFMIDDSWPVGFWFFQNMIEDKVSAAFLVAPVFFFFALNFLQLPTKNNLLLFFLCGIGLTLTHPVILFLACVIAGGMTLISWMLEKTKWQDVFRLLGVVVIILLPYTIIRFYDHSNVSLFDAKGVSTTFQVDRYVNVINDIFYGLNPDVLKLFNVSPESGFYSAFQVVRLLPVFLVLIAVFFAFRNIKDGVLCWYIIICVLLVAFATIPYTGWILGYFISVRMISRVSWFSPLGLAGTLVFIQTLEILKGRPFAGRIIKVYEHQTESSKNVGKNIMMSLVIAIIMLSSVILPRAPYYFEVLGGYKQLARIGSYIDQTTDGVATVIALEYSDTQMLPSVSAHANLISFREEIEYNGFNNFLPIDDVRAMIYASNTIRSLDSNVTSDERCFLIKKYHVRFIMARLENAHDYGSVIGACGTQINFVTETKDLVLMKIE